MTGPTCYGTRSPTRRRHASTVKVTPPASSQCGGFVASPANPYAGEREPRLQRWRPSSTSSSSSPRRRCSSSSSPPVPQPLPSSTAVSALPGVPVSSLFLRGCAGELVLMTISCVFSFGREGAGLPSEGERRGGRPRSRRQGRAGYLQDLCLHR